jgi:hypothetical protein
MRMQFNTILAAAIVASVPLHLESNTQRPSNEPLAPKEVRKAGAQARTAADHFRLAAWYRSEALQAQANLTEREDLVKHLGQNPEMVTCTKIPNPYWNAQAWVRIYREKLGCYPPRSNGSKPPTNTTLRLSRT